MDELTRDLLVTGDSRDRADFHFAARDLCKLRKTEGRTAFYAVKDSDFFDFFLAAQGHPHITVESRRDGQWVCLCGNSNDGYVRSRARLLGEAALTLALFGFFAAIAILS